jgi:acetylornithine/succinyldiaminopimelate/putrescine aminotransferase
VELNAEPKDLVAHGLRQGVVINLTAKKVVRIAPAIDIDRTTLIDGLERAARAMSAAVA